MAASAAPILASGSKRYTGSIPPSASHHSVPPAFTSAFRGTTSSSAPTRCPHGKVGLAEPHCSRLLPPPPELQAAKAPLLISEPTSIRDV